MTYDELLALLESCADKTYASFHSKLIKSSTDTLLGVRVPILRKIAKKVNIQEILEFPNEYYEVKFIKLVSVSYLPFDKFILYLEKVVPLIDNWALCDSFKANSILSNRENFLPWIEKYHSKNNEFSVRYALVTLLNYYVEEEYLPLIFAYLKKTDCREYYVHMAAAWLMAEILAKYFEAGVSFLKTKVLNEKTHNKSIQKAIESYRLTNEQKEFLRTLKIKNI